MIKYRTEPTWTDERLDQITSLWNEGNGQREIARRMKMSPNTIIGKISRLIDAGILMARNETFRPKPPAPRKAVRFNPSYTEKSPPTPSEPEVLEPLLIDGKPITIRTCSDKHCRWPLSDATADMVMCGRPPVAGKPYCEAHNRKVYQPQQYAAARQRQAEKTADAAG